jgi:hypothetical protein
MRFTVKDTLTEEEVQSGLRAVIDDGLASQTMVILAPFKGPSQAKKSSLSEK